MRHEGALVERSTWWKGGVQNLAALEADPMHPERCLAPVHKVHNAWRRGRRPDAAELAVVALRACRGLLLPGDSVSVGLPHCELVSAPHCHHRRFTCTLHAHDGRAGDLMG